MLPGPSLSTPGRDPDGSRVRHVCRQFLDSRQRALGLPGRVRRVAPTAPAGGCDFEHYGLGRIGEFPCQNISERLRSFSCLGSY